MGIGMYTYMSTSNTKIAGMFSGMDTQSLVDSLMSLEQMKVDKIFQQREKAQWKNDAYTAVNTSINNMRNSFLSVIGSQSVVKNGAYNAYSAKVSENDAIKITATDGAGVNSFNIKSVQAATSASYSSNVRGEIQDGQDAIKRSDTIAKALAKMNPNAQYDSETGDVIFDNEEDKTLKVKVNGQEFSFDKATTTISQMMNTINSNADAKAVFTYSEMTDSFSISSMDSGKDSKIEIEGLEAFGLDPNDQTGYKEGKNAIVTLSDGKTIEQSSNNFTVDGLKFEILGDYQAQGASSIRVDITRDNSATVSAIKAFTEEYNKLMDQLNSLYHGEKNRSYAPLTDMQRADMTEKEAEQWDEMAKSGVLRNDPVIGSLITNLRSSLFNAVEGTGVLRSSPSNAVEGMGVSAADLGLTTMAWNDMDDWKKDQGKIVFDESKLLAALEKNPSAVQDVFTKITNDYKGDVDATVDEKGVAKSGLFTRMSEMLSNAASTLRNTNMQNTQKQVSEYNTKMNDMLKKMSDIEERYWKQYSALETALSEMQSQQQWLSAQLGMGLS